MAGVPRVGKLLQHEQTNVLGIDRRQSLVMISRISPLDRL